jgi:hypothetical protein
MHKKCKDECLQDHDDGVRLHLWTATTEPIVHPPGDIWAWRTMVEWHWKGKTPDSSTRDFQQTYQQTSSSKSGGTLQRKIKNVAFILLIKVKCYVRSYATVEISHPKLYSPRLASDKTRTFLMRIPHSGSGCSSTILKLIGCLKLRCRQTVDAPNNQLWLSSLGTAASLLVPSQPKQKEGT